MHALATSPYFDFDVTAEILSGRFNARISTDHLRAWLMQLGWVTAGNVPGDGVQRYVRKSEDADTTLTPKGVHELIRTLARPAKMNQLLNTTIPVMAAS